MTPSPGWVPGIALTALCACGLFQPWLRQPLRAQDIASQHSHAPLTDISKSTDVAWLQRIAMSAEFAAQLAADPAWPQTSVLRSRAYVRLGDVGTPASLAAVASIEASMAKRVTVTPTTNTTEWPRSWNREGKGLAESVGPDGRTYRVLFWNLQGPYDLFLTSSRTPANRRSWSRPLPTRSAVDWPPPTVTISWRGEDTIVLRYTMRSQRARTRSVSLSALRKDRDADGWTDEEERLLGLDPRRSDSDDDGIPDGADTCPLLPGRTTSDERALAIQRVFLTVFGFSNQHQALRVTSEPVHLFGYGAPVLFGFAHPRDLVGHGATYITWKTWRSGADMQVEISTWNDVLAGDLFRYVLKRFNDQWFVVGGGLAGIS